MLSTMKLSKTENEDLSLGLKFSTDLNNGDIIDTIVVNHEMMDTNFEKGFILQGIITFYI